MKITHLFLLSGMCMLSALQAQEENQTQTSKRENFLFISPINLFMNTLELGYEKRLKKHNSLAFTGGFTLSKERNKLNDIGGSGELQYKINLLYNKEAISAISRKYTTFAYFAPYLMYRYLEVMDVNSYEPYTQNAVNDRTTYVSSFFGGAGFGMRVSGMENRFTLNLFLGGGLRYSEVKGLDSYTGFMKPGYTGIAPKAGFQMGIAF